MASSLSLLEVRYKVRYTEHKAEHYFCSVPWIAPLEDTVVCRIMYTAILRRVNRMKIFVFVYIRPWGGLVAQGVWGIHRSCFGTQNKNDNRNGNRNSVDRRGVYCTCLGTRNRYGVRGYCTCLSTRNRYGII